MKDIPLKKIFFVFLKIGTFAFGGVYSMLAFFERELVRKKRWLNEEEFSEAVAIGQLTPGAPIINTGIFIGYFLRRFRGAVVTILGQVLPSLVIVIILGYIYVKYREVQEVKAFLKGIGAAVVGLILSVIYKLSRRIINKPSAAAIGSSVFLLAFFKINPILLLILSGITGLIIYGRRNV
ncbi:MAG: chromate transporter [Thermodesulfovibrionales bacterium]|nr:chromate transporter [Thermodesulfovibrionales bacterium]